MRIERDNTDAREYERGWFGRMGKLLDHLRIRRTVRKNLDPHVPIAHQKVSVAPDDSEVKKLIVEGYRNAERLFVESHEYAVYEKPAVIARRNCAIRCLIAPELAKRHIKPSRAILSELQKRNIEDIKIHAHRLAQRDMDSQRIVGRATKGSDRLDFNSLRPSNGRQQQRSSAKNETHQKPPSTKAQVETNQQTSLPIRAGQANSPEPLGLTSTGPAVRGE